MNFIEILINGLKDSKKLKFYKILLHNMRNYCDIGINIISYSRIDWFLGRYGISKSFSIKVIKEMIKLGLLKRNSKRELILLGKRQQLPAAF